MREMPSGAAGVRGSLQRQPLAAGVLMHPQNMFINNFSKLPANPQFWNICGRADNLYKLYMG